MTVIPLDKAIRTKVQRELKLAKTKYGEHYFEIVCIEGSWGYTLDDRQALRLVRALNRTGSMFQEVIGRV